MTYCTAPDTTATEADTTVVPGPSSRGRGIPRGRATGTRGRAAVARAAVMSGEQGVKRKAAMTPVERRRREVCCRSLETEYELIGGL